MKHLRTLKFLNLILAALFALVSLPSLIFVLAGAVRLPGQPKEGLAFVLFGLLFFGILAGLAMAHAYVGFMVTAGRARPLQTVLAVLHLSNFPVGTVYSVYALWVCYANDDAMAAFERPLGRRVQ